MLFPNKRMALQNNPDLPKQIDGFATQNKGLPTQINGFAKITDLPKQINGFAKKAIIFQNKAMVCK